MHPATDAPRLPAYGGERPGPDTSRVVQPSLGAVVLLAVLLGAAPIGAVELLRSRLYVVVAAPTYLAFHNVAELFGIVVALSIFGVGWFTHGLSRDRHTLFLACAFLGAGLIGFMHAMSLPGMPDFFGANSAGKASQYRIAMQAFTALALLASAFVRPDARSRWLSRRVLVTLVLATAGLVFAAVTFFPERVPPTFDATTGSTRFEILAEVAIVLLFLLAVPAYAWRSRRTGDALTGYYAAAFVLSGYGELVFTAYPGVFDTFDGLGHAYRVVALCLVYRAVIVGSLRAPYLGLAAERGALEAESLDRRAAEEALRSSEQRLALHLDQLLLAVVEWDTEFRVRHWNPAAERIFGYRSDEALGRRGPDLIIPKRIHAEVDGVWRELLAGRGGRVYVNENTTKDGRLVTCEWHNTPLVGPTGHVTGVMSLALDVTERVRAEEALRRSEESLRTAQRIAHVGNWDLDLTRNQLRWSDEIYRMFEIDPRQFGASYEAFLDAVHPEDRQAVNEAYTRSVADRIPYEITHRLLMKDGRVKHVRERCETFYDETGKPLRSIGAVQDVTERAEAEDQARAAGLYARSLIEASLDPLVTISPEGKVTDVNRATEEVTGVTRGRLIGTDFADYFTEPELARAGYRSVLELGTVRDYPLTIRHTSGRTVDVLYNAAVYRDAAGRLQGVFAAARDVTERKRAEAARAHLAAIIESSSDAIVGKSLEGIVQSWNLGAERIYGYTAAEMIGRPIGVLSPPGLESEGPRLLERVLQGEAVVHEETTRARKDGRVIDVALTLSPIRSAAGTITGVSTIARDVTERKRAERELARLASQLEQRVAERTEQLAASNRELEAFAYSVSHDLRAPLRHITGFVELLQRRTQAASVDEQARHYAAVISEAAVAMGKMIDDLLSFSRMGRTEMAKSRVDVGALVQEVIRELAPETAGRIVGWKVGEIPPVDADRPMLRLAMTNLLSNAAKFTRTRPRAEIEIGCAPPGERPETVIFVRDNGVGFDMKYADKLFHVFQRLHRAEDFEGTGIGLANVRRIVERHGGRVWAEGAPDRGAAFFFSLPRPPPGDTP